MWRVHAVQLVAEVSQQGKQRRRMHDEPEEETEVTDLDADSAHLSAGHHKEYFKTPWRCIHDLKTY